MAPTDQSCPQYALSLGAIMAGASVPVGFFRAHDRLKSLTIQEKLIKMNSFRVAGPAIAGPMVTFAAAGAAFGAADCAMQHYLGRRDSLTAVVGGLAVGGVLGLRKGSMPATLGYGAAAAGVMLVVDFITKIAHPVFDDIKVHGPKEVPSPAQ